MGVAHLIVRTRLLLTVFGVGGFGGAAAVSGEVSVDHTGSIQTVGDWGHGILAQSLAGGGGNGGFNVSASANWTSKR